VNTFFEKLFLSSQKSFLISPDHFNMVKEQQIDGLKLPSSFQFDFHFLWPLIKNLKNI